MRSCSARFQPLPCSSLAQQSGPALQMAYEFRQMRALARCSMWLPSQYHNNTLLDSQAAAEEATSQAATAAQAVSQQKLAAARDDAELLQRSLAAERATAAATDATNAAVIRSLSQQLYDTEQSRIRSMQVLAFSISKQEAA